MIGNDKNLGGGWEGGGGGTHFWPAEESGSMVQRACGELSGEIHIKIMRPYVLIICS